MNTIPLENAKESKYCRETSRELVAIRRRKKRDDRWNAGGDRYEDGGERERERAGERDKNNTIEGQKMKVIQKYN